MTSVAETCRVDIAVFAHNEEQNIKALLDTLARQDIIVQPGLSVRVVICANGCTDRTVIFANNAISGLKQFETYEVLNLPEGG